MLSVPSYSAVDLNTSFTFKVCTLQTNFKIHPILTYLEYEREDRLQ
jgi:hypothetical protein